MQTVSQMVQILALICFQCLRAEYREPYLEEWPDENEAAIMAIRRPLLHAEKGHGSWRNACMMCDMQALRGDEYPRLHFGSTVAGRHGKPVAVRLHVVMTYLMYGPPEDKSPDWCACHEDEAHAHGHNDQRQRTQRRKRKRGAGSSSSTRVIGRGPRTSARCRSRYCLSSEHLIGWHDRAWNVTQAHEHRVDMFARPKL